MGFLLFAIFVGLCVAQPGLYTSAFNQADYAHTITLNLMNCTYHQDQYSVIFWHRFSLTSPTYQGNINPFTLARLTSSPTFADYNDYSDRHLYVESNGDSFEICSHDTESQNVNVCTSISITGKRYDMQWIFMSFQYRKEGIIKIYIYMMDQNVEIFQTLSNVKNTQITDFLGLYLGGTQFLKEALNGWIYNPQILLGHQSQYRYYENLKNIMLDLPPQDKIHQQHIQIPLGIQKQIKGIYTQLGFYGTFISTNMISNDQIVLLYVDGSGGQTSLIGSTLIKIIINNSNLEFYSDYYTAINDSSTYYLNQLISSFPIIDNQLYNYFVALNYETAVIQISLSTDNSSSPISYSSKGNAIPSFITVYAQQFVNGQYFEVNLVGASFGGGYGKFFQQLTRYSIDPYFFQNVGTIQSMYFCFWWRLSSTFPYPYGQTNNVSNLANIPLFSINVNSMTPETYCQTGSTTQFLCAQLDNYRLKYNLYQGASYIYDTAFYQAKAESQWNLSCITYKAETDSTPPLVKVYQLVAGKQQETQVSQSLSLGTGTFQLNLQLSFPPEYINKQFFNMQLSINTITEDSFIEQLYDFNDKIKQTPVFRNDDSKYVVNMLPFQETFHSSGVGMTEVVDGLQFITEYSVTLWIKLDNSVDQTILTAEIVPGILTYIGKIFKLSYMAATSKFSLVTYSKQNIDVNDDYTVRQTIYLDNTTCNPTKYFFVYLGYSFTLKEVKLGLICNSGNIRLQKSSASIGPIYHLPVSSFNLQIDTSFSGKISQLRINLGLYSYEEKDFGDTSDDSLNGKWECAYRTQFCTSPQLESTNGSKKCKGTYALSFLSDLVTGSECNITCPCGFFSDASNNYQCTQCSKAAPNCLYCIDNTDAQQCTYCEKGYNVTPKLTQFYPDYNKGYCSCNSPGFVYYLGSCVACDPTCLECSQSPTNCTKCNPLATLSSTATCSCIEGYYLTSTFSCAKCASTCKTCSGTSTTCLSCNDFQFRQLNNGTQTCDCLPQYADIFNQGGNYCAYCDPLKGYLLLNISTCSSCDANCKTCQTASITCTSCNQSLKRTLNVSTDTCDCKTGYYSNDTFSSCLQCAADCKTCQTYSTFCISCSFDRALQYIDSTTQTCVCNSSLKYFTQADGTCAASSLKASLSDYYSKTETDVIYFSISFNYVIDQWNQNPSSLFSKVTMRGLPNSHNPVVPSRLLSSETTRILANDINQSFFLTAEWANALTLAVEVRFLRSFMHRDLVITLGNTDGSGVSSLGTIGGYLQNQDLTLPINLIVYPPNQNSFSTTFENLISCASQLSHPTNGFVEFLLNIFRDCYVILIIFPFFQTVIILLSFSTVLPSNLFHLLRMISELTMLQDIAMQEENSQAQSTQYFFRIQQEILSKFRDNLDDNFKRLNFTNSAWVMTCTSVILIFILQVSYILLNRYYENQIRAVLIIESEKLKDKRLSKYEIKQRPYFKRIKALFVICNLISAALIKGIFFLLCCSALINFKSQYFEYPEQIIGYIMSMLMCWGFLIYLSNLYSVLSNRVHYRIIQEQCTYLNFILQTSNGNNHEGQGWHSERYHTEELEDEFQNDIKSGTVPISNLPLITFKFFKFKGFDYEFNEQDNGTMRKAGTKGSSSSESITPETIKEPLITRIRHFRHFYHLINLVRKLLLAIFIVYFSDKFFGQMVPFLLLQTLFIGQVVIFKPKSSRCLNIIKIIGEVSLLVVIILIFVSHKIQSDLDSDYSNSYIPDDKISSFLKLGQAQLVFVCLYFIAILVSSTIEFISFLMNLFFPKKNNSPKQIISQNSSESSEDTIKKTDGPLVVMELGKIQTSLRESLEKVKRSDRVTFEFDCELSQRYSKPFLERNSKLFKKPN